MSAVLAGGQQADHYQATLQLEEGASVYITAPTIDLLAQLVARTKGQIAANEAPGKSAKSSSATSATAAVAPTAAPSPAEAPGKSAAAAAPTPPSATPAAAPATQPSASAGEVTQDMVNKAVIALAGAKGRDAAVAVLTGFGVAKATELKAEQRAAAHAALTAAMGA